MGRSTQGPKNARGGKKHQEEPSLLFAPVAAAEHHLGTCQDLKISALHEPGLFLIQMVCLSSFPACTSDCPGKME